MEEAVFTKYSYYHKYDPIAQAWEIQEVALSLTEEDLKVVAAAKEFLFEKWKCEQTTLQLIGYKRPTESIPGRITFLDKASEKIRLQTPDGKTFHQKRGFPACCNIL